VITVALDKKRHDRKRFDCGVEVLNSYLRVMAYQQASKDNTRTFVIEDQQQTNFIVGFYTLTMISLNLTALPQKLQNKHQSAQAGGLIARLAVDKRYIKKGYGEFLLIDALKKLLITSEMVAFPLIIVDAKQGVESFYQRFGFTPFLDTPNKLFITLADVRNNLNIINHT